MVRRTDILAETEELSAPIETLSQVEIEILTLAAKGETRAEISSRMSLSKETIKDYAARTLRKLGARNKANAVAIGCTLEIIRPYSRAIKKDADK